MDNERILKEEDEETEEVRILRRRRRKKRRSSHIYVVGENMRRSLAKEEAREGAAA